MEVEESNEKHRTPHTVNGVSIYFHTGKACVVNLIR